MQEPSYEALLGMIQGERCLSSDGGIREAEGWVDLGCSLKEELIRRVKEELISMVAEGKSGTQVDSSIFGIIEV